MNKHTQQKSKNIQSGFTLLIAILTAGVVVAIGLAILGVTFKQITLTGVERESEVAFQAANAGLECIRYHDFSTSNGNKFDVGVSPSSPECFGGGPDSAPNNAPESGEEQQYEWTWGENNDLCSSVSVYKFYNENGSVAVTDGTTTYRTCPAQTECTLVKARGYNSACGSVGAEGTVEREITAVY